MRVLVVDDSKAMRMIVIRSLKQCEFGDLEITEAVNGVEALDRIKERAPHLVLSDWNMPEMNGIDLLRAVRELDYRFPFGFITSESSGRSDAGRRGWSRLHHQQTVLRRLNETGYRARFDHILIAT